MKLRIEATFIKLINEPQKGEAPLLSILFQIYLFGCWECVNKSQSVS